MAVQEVGVEAVVKGLAAFQGDMRKINSSLQDLRGEGTFLQKAFGSLTDGILNFGSHIARVAEVALGVLLRDAVRAAIDMVKELISTTIEAGNQFQTLELRLQGLNVNQLVEDGKSYNQAQKEAVELTKEQLEWLQRIAAQSPYDATDVANLYTLARSYGFTADEAQKLTESIMNFASGMGLGSQEMERIIVNFGQLRAQGKLNSQELRDLARGAFVPVNDIMKIATENMTKAGIVTNDYTDEIKKEQERLAGLEKDLELATLKQQEFTETTKESTRLANQYRIDELRAEIDKTRATISDFQERTGKAVEITMDNLDSLKQKGLLTGDAVDIFIQSFQQLVEQRFAGATEKMSQTFKAATDNILDLVKGIFGLNTVKPILDVLGQRAAAFADAFTNDPEKWDALVNAASRLGEALASVVTDLFGLLPGVGDLADRIIELITQAAQWVEDNRENIVGFFQGIANTIRDDLVPWIRDNLLPAIMEFVSWVSENKGEILDFFKGMATTIMDDVVPLVRDELLPLFRKFGDWFLENKDLIIELFDKLGDAVLQLAEIFLPKLESAMEWIKENPQLVEMMITAWAKWQVIGTILNVVGGILISIIGFILSLGAAISGAISIISLLGGSFFSIAALILGAIVQFKIFKFYISIITDSIERWKNIIVSWATTVSEVVSNIVDAIKNRDWNELGRAIIEGIATGIRWSASTVIDAAQDTVQDMVDSVKNLIGMNSPPKLFVDIGSATMQAFAMGIQRSAGLAAGSMAAAISQVAAVSTPSVTNSTTYNNNYNLTVNSNAPTEPVIQDFSMMQSLAGI